MLTIITPTFNRGYCIDRAYESLKQQSNKSFEWIIVDDGSTDNTQEVVNLWIKDGIVSIKYIYKENGGKHTALNVGFVEATGDLICILDSDDYLIDDAIDVIGNEWEAVKNNQEIAGLHFLKGFHGTRKCIGTPFLNDFEVDSSIKIHYYDHVCGDKCKIYRSNILKNNLFPVFEGERMLGESTLWNKIGKKYKLLNVNKILQLCEYLPDGLTANSGNCVWQNPMGVAACANEKVTSEFPLVVRLRAVITYVSRSLYFNSWYEVINQSKCRRLCILLYPLGFVWYCYAKSRNRNSVSG